jgi:peptide chain release factor 3
VASDSRADLEAFLEKNKAQMAEDLDGAPVFMAKSAWEVHYVADKIPRSASRR